MTKPRVALVHDWLTGMRGGEKVLELLCESYPDADLLTLFHVPHSVSPAIERLHRKTSILQYVPGIGRIYRYCLPIFPTVIEQFDLDDYDLVISTSHCAAKAVIKTGRAKHLCYCFTPMRYAWDQFEAYFDRERVGSLASGVLRPVMGRLARWDAATADRADRYVAISQYVASRIRRYYNRDAQVIYPPVDTGFYTPNGIRPEDFLLIVSALVPYKRIEIAIRACRLAGVPLRIAGSGPERDRLMKIAADQRADVTFLGPVSNDEIRDLYRHAMAVLLPGEEDFGIVPVEAQACGRPVIALASGGALETVVDGITGALVEDATPEAFAEAIAKVQSTTFDPHVIRANAVKFDRAVFAASMQTTIESLVNA